MITNIPLKPFSQSTSFRLTRWPRFFVFGVAFWYGVFSINIGLAISSPSKVVDHVTIEHQADGKIPLYTLPIYQSGNIRYLSAGVGLEERTATYPPFPLKLVFAQAGGALLANVSVTIQDQAGNEVLKVPKDQVNGPWLFIDLAPGTYRITAVRGDGTEVKKTVKVAKGKTKGIYLHWPRSKG